jgi:hypothetical protein
MRAGIEVSVLIPVLNEAGIIRSTAAKMLAQDFDGAIEFLFLDGGSSDGTREIVERLAAADPRVRVLDNPERIQAAALNLGLARCEGRFVARMDAHAFYPPGYVAAGVARLSRGDVAWVSGPQLPYGVDRWSRRVALALTSPLGVGGAGFRRMPEGDIEIDTGFTGMWARGTLERLGGWSPGWRVNEDGELAARVARDGGRMVCIGAMAARSVPRSSLGASPASTSGTASTGPRPCSATREAAAPRTRCRRLCVPLPKYRQLRGRCQRAGERLSRQASELAQPAGQAFMLTPRAGYCVGDVGGERRDRAAGGRCV